MHPNVHSKRLVVILKRNNIQATLPSALALVPNSRKVLKDVQLIPIEISKSKNTTVLVEVEVTSIDE